MKKMIILMVLAVLLWPIGGSAQDFVGENQVFEAKVVKVLKERRLEREDGSTAVQQDLLLRGLSGEWLEKEMETVGVGDIDVMKSVYAEAGDKVVVQASSDPDGKTVFVVTDHVRRGWLYFLFLLFAAAAVIVGRRNGFKALVSLAASFFIIMKFIVPRILAGSNALFVSIIGALIILFAVIYITWGFTRKANIAFVGIFLSLFCTGVISVLFTKLTQLTGTAQEEAMFLVGVAQSAIDFKGLLLAGIIIGTLGVLDDVAIGQISAVEQLKRTDPNLRSGELFCRAIRIGVDHISSMINTLFLAYAGAALPLLLLFSVKAEPFATYSQVLNNELIATEIVRTLTGSIGLILAVPICTWLAVRLIRVEKEKRS